MKKIAIVFVSLLTSLLAAFLIPSPAQAAVWTETNEWSSAWEQRYSQWVQDNWNVNFFASPTTRNGQSNPYYGLRTDCADTVYSMRIVFAYENKLPFVIQDPSALGSTLSNRMSRWDSQREGDRIRNFLRFIYDIASTHSLPNDTVPVAVNRQWVRPGGLIMTVKKNHHSWSIKTILPIGVPYLIFNSVLGSGASSLLQERQSWPNPEWVFEGDDSPSGNAGFRYWKAAGYATSPNWQVPGYSEEQYQVPLKNWVNWAQKRLATRQEGDSQMIKRLMTTVCEGMKSRIPAVRDAVKYVQQHGGACMKDYATYDNYSTPSRDQRIFDDLKMLRSSYRDVLKNSRGNDLSSGQKAQLAKIFPLINQSASDETNAMTQKGVTSASVCVIEYAPGKQVDMADFKHRLFSGRVSNNPNDSMAYRWGEVRGGPSDRARTCQSWDPWTPNLGRN